LQQLKKIPLKESLPKHLLLPKKQQRRKHCKDKTQLNPNRKNLNMKNRVKTRRPKQRIKRSEH